MIVALSGLWSTNCVVSCAVYPTLPPSKKVYPVPPPPPPQKGQRVACASAETVQCLRSQNS